MSIIDQIIEHYPDAQKRVSPVGQERAYLLRGNRRIVIHDHVSDDAVDVSAWIVYGGNEDDAYLDGRTYKSSRATMRWINEKLGRWGRDRG